VGGGVSLAPRSRLPGPLRWVVRLLAGVAGTALAGYLLAALVLFPAPLRPSEREVAQVAGLTEEDAIHTLERQNLVAAITAREPNPRMPEGMVIWQDPPPGVALPRGDTVRLTVSAGAPNVAVPDVRGYDADLARRLIVAAGLRVDLVDTVAMKTAQAGTVGTTTPAAGSSIPAGSGVVLHLVQ